jgi:hypothetical protein
MRAKLKRYWPNGLSALVIKAAFHPNPKIASDSWRSWQDQCDFDRTLFGDIRVASIAYRRLGDVSSAKKLEPRLVGLQRYIWSAVKLRIDAGTPLLHKFAEATVRFMLIKGSVLFACNSAAAVDRFMADIDVLIDHRDWGKAINVALTNGWSIDMAPESAVARMHQRHHSLSLQRGSQGAVDLHQFSLLLNRQLGSDLMLWQRARRGFFNGVSVLLPHPSDQLAIVFGHCFLYAPAPTHDWIFDAQAAISSLGFDWDIFTDVVIERELAVPAAVGLNYLADELQWPIPRFVLKRIARQVRRPFSTEFAAVHRTYDTKNRAESRAIYYAECIRSRRMIGRVTRPQAPELNKTTETVFANVQPKEKVYLEMPAVDPGESVAFRLAIEVEGLPPRTSAGLLLRCFEGIPLEIARLVVKSKQGPQKLNGRINGALIAAREIDKLWLMLRKAPSGVTLRGSFRASVSQDRWTEWPNLTYLVEDVGTLIEELKNLARDSKRLWGATATRSQSS